MVEFMNKGNVGRLRDGQKGQGSRRRDLYGDEDKVDAASSLALHVRAAPMPQLVFLWEEIGGRYELVVRSEMHIAGEGDCCKWTEGSMLQMPGLIRG